jgi:hypothetical protein
MRTANIHTAIRVVRATLALTLVAAGAPLAAQQFATGPLAHAGLVPLGPAVKSALLDAPVSLSVRAPLRWVVARIAAQADLSVVFDDSLPGLGASVSIDVTSVPARVALVRVLEGSSLRALVSPSGTIVLATRESRAARYLPVTGTVRDSVAGTPVSGARIELLGTRYYAYTRPDGTFSMGD